VLSNKPFAEITDANTLRRLQIGHDYFSLPQQIGPDVADVVRDDPMRLNFIRLQKEHGLYAERTNGVTFLTPTVFRAEIPVPALAPFGANDVQVRLFAGGNQLTQSNTAFEVVKVGFEQFIANSARDYGLLYGIATVMMAMLTGWFASVVFRKD
jgi:uncharacterized protein (TIGR02186 family)